MNPSFLPKFFFLALLVFFPSAALLAEELQLLRITPSGDDVPAGREIVFEFNQTMVALGRMDREPEEVAVKIDPDPGCEWRWLNTTSLACQLDEQHALKPSTRYKISVGADFKSFSGLTLGEVKKFEIITERARVNSYWFETWKAPGLPWMHVQLNQRVLSSSLADHLFLQDQSGKRFDLRVEEVKDADAVENEYRIYPKEELPLESRISLQVEPGIRSSEGDEPAIEQRSIVEFLTFPEFRFLGVNCRNNAGDEILLAHGVSSAALCDPLDAITLQFSSPVMRDAAKSGITSTPDFAGGREDFDPWEGVYSYSALGYAPSEQSSYRLNLPYPLKAAQAYALHLDAENIQDEFGRKLSESVDFHFSTDHRRPRYHLEHEFSVLERDVPSELPVVVTNLNALDISYSLQTAGGFQSGLTKRLKIDPALDVAYHYPLGIRNLVEKGSGIVRGVLVPHSEIGSIPANRGGNWRFMSQITPFHVHLKLGHFNSLAWVTDLSSGKPVQNAQVSVIADQAFNPSESAVVLASASTDSNGVANFAGIEQIDPNLKYYSQWDKNKPILLLKVVRGADIALLPVYYDFRVYSSGAYSWKRKQYGHLKAWGATAQGIYRLGDTLDYKLYVRHQDKNSFVQPPRSGYTLTVYDALDKQVFRQEKIRLSDFGSYAGSFPIPETGSVGWYRFELEASFTDLKWEPLRVLVSDFTPAPFRVSTELNSKSYQNEERLEFHTSAKLHAGGPYGDAPVRVTARLSPGWLHVNNTALKDFIFSTDGEQQYEQQLYQQDLKLNAQGELEESFVLNADKVVYGDLLLESSVRDDRGKSIAGRSSAKFFGRNRYVGLRQSDWILEQAKKASFDVVVIDTEFNKLDGISVKAKVEREEIKASRVKSAGNAYLTSYLSEWREIASCDLRSAENPVACEFTPDGPGHFRISATIQDSKGREHTSSIHRWASGRGWNLWQSPESTELKIIAESENLKVGDTARFMVQNPYPGARALISIERYGIQKSWVQSFKESSEVLEIPITEDQLPGFYLSVLLMSPRVEQPLSEDNVDLGKPVFRMGYVKVDVQDKAKELQVQVTPQGQDFRPGDTVTVDIQAKKPGAGAVPTEFAVTVLDQSVFDLLSGGRDLFDPYKGFYALDTLDVDNFNLLRMLIGRQKFEKKGASAGGDGGSTGKIDMRSLFRFVSYWNPAIRADKDGKAQIKFQVPDNLTGWLVFVMAVDRNDLMGLGEGSFKVNKPTEIRPALPNQLLEGDSLEAKFTVMNRTEQPRTLHIRGEAKGSALGVPVTLEKTLELQPFKREPISFEIQAKTAGEVLFQVSAKDDTDSDALEARLPVRPAYAMQTAATFGSLDQESPEVKVPVLFPQDILIDRGGLALISSPSILPALGTAFEYMKSYPYSCWEQKITRAVAAAHYLKLKPFTDPAFSWPDAEDIIKQTLEAASAYQAASGGMAYYLAQDQYVSPYLSAYTAQAFNWLGDLGYRIPQTVQAALEEYLLKLLRRDVAPDFYSAGMAATVRALALAALAEHGKLDTQDLNRYATHVDQMTLFGKSHFLRAASRLGDVTFRKNIYDKIMSFSNQSSGKITFSEKLDANFERIHESTQRTNCAILEALLKLHKKDPALQRAEHLVSMGRSIAQSISAPHGQLNTQELIYCMNSLIEYQKNFEVDKPDLKYSVNLSTQVFGTGEFHQLTAKPQRFDREMHPLDPGSRAELEIIKAGTGRLYYQTQLSYAPKQLPDKATNSGMQLWREISLERDGKWRKISSPYRIKVGDLLRIDLFLSLPASRNFVVLDDPIPGGLEPVNRDLATSSQMDADKAQDLFSSDSIWHSYADWWGYAGSFWNFYHKELRHDFARFYAEYLEAGRYHLSYTAQAIAPGEFTILPPKALEMYHEDVYGMGIAETLEVSE